MHRAARQRPADSTGRIRSRGTGRNRSVALLLDAGGFADPVAEVVELGPAHVTATEDFNGLDDRSVNGENAFDTDAKADLPNRERLADAATLAGNHNTFERLGPFPATLDDTNVHAHGVAGTEVRYVIAQLGALDVIERVHGILQDKGEERTRMVATREPK